MHKITFAILAFTTTLVIDIISALKLSFDYHHYQSLPIIIIVVNIVIIIIIAVIVLVNSIIHCHHQHKNHQNPQSSKITIKTNNIIILFHQVCYYNTGAMFDLVDPGPGNKAEEGVVDEVLRFYIHNTLWGLLT